MKEQEYIVKKYIRARSAAEAIERESTSPVSEVYLASDKPESSNAHAVGFYIGPEPVLTYEV